MRVFGFYRAEEEGVDLSVVSFLPEPRAVALFGGGRFLLLRRVMGLIHGFSGFALLYSDYEPVDGGVVVETEAPLFISEGGFFSDAPAALVAVGVPLDIGACRRFIEEGDDGRLVPLKDTRRIGGRVRLTLKGDGPSFEEVGEGSIGAEGWKPEKFRLLPDVLGGAWRLKLMTMGRERKMRAYTVERWGWGFAALK
ncbi:MAG: hypothetical protein GXO29_03370 [Thermotogae bacterium]|nr:hypothetical protein [Thermotogota bacterium]